MITISPVTATDVDVLKCILFQRTKSFMEVSWYGLDCNLDLITDDIENAFVYLESLITECDLEHRFECEIKSFITKKSSHCIFQDSSCDPIYTVTPLPFIITEGGIIISTESDENLIIE